MKLIIFWVKWLLKRIVYQILVGGNSDHSQLTSGEEKALCPPTDQSSFSIRTGIGALILSVSSPMAASGSWLSAIKYTLCLTGIVRRS